MHLDTEELKTQLSRFKLKGGHSFLLELGLSFLILSFILYQERGLLFTPNYIAPHDNYYFLFPIFSFFANGLINGHLPLWNPYSHGGEAFYPLLVHAQLLDPVAWLVVGMGKIFTVNLSLLFHWNLFFHSVLAAAGTFFFLRRWAKFSLSRYLLILVLGLSSSFLLPLRQPGFLYQYQWAPWILLVIDRIIEEKRAHPSQWCCLGILLALQMQSYWFTGILTFLILGGSSLYLNGKASALKSLSLRRNSKGYFILFLFICVGMLPNLALLVRQHEWISPMRSALPAQGQTKALGAPVLYESATNEGERFAWVSLSNVISTGSFAKLTDFIQLAYPHGNSSVHKRAQAWGVTSEAWMYLGLIPFVLLLLGFFFGIEEWHSTWRGLAFALAALMLGPPFLFYDIAFFLLPPLWFLRHLHTLQSFFFLCLLYFLILGCNIVSEFFSSPKTREIKFSSLFPNFKSPQKLGFPKIFLVFGLLFLASFSLPVFLSEDLFLSPLVRFLGVGILLALSLVWRWLGKELCFYSLLCLFFFQNAFLCPTPFRYLFHLSTLCLIPLLLLVVYLLAKKNPLLASEKFRGWSLFLLCLATSLDLVLAFNDARYLYAGQINPSAAFQLPMEARSVEPPQTRIAFLQAPVAKTDPVQEQTPRYLSLLSRVPTALSELWVLKSDTKLSFENALHTKRWNSFILSKNYHHLLYSGLPDSVLRHIFLIGKNPFQWKREWHTANNERSALQILDQTKDSVPLVLLSSDRTSTKQNAEPSSFRYLVTKYDYNEISLETQSSRDGYLYWGDGFDPDWISEVDGSPFKIERANLAFKAIFLPSGIHHVEFRYRPTAFLIATRIYLGVILFSTALLSLSVLLKTLLKLFRRNPWESKWIATN